jgi:hypothetical protein
MYSHQEEAESVSGLKQDLCETNEAELRDQRQVPEVVLKKLAMSNNNFHKHQKYELTEVLLRYTELFTTRTRACKVYEYKFDIADTTAIIGHSRPMPYSGRASIRKRIKQTVEDAILKLSE